MATENAVKDSNNSFGLLIHSADGTETRKVKAGANGGLPIEPVGLSTATRLLDVDETEDEISATAVVLTGYYIANRAAGERHVKLYDGAAAAVTVGTTVPILTISLAAGQAANLSQIQVPFDNGLCIAATTGVLDNDTGAPGANDIVANIFTRAA